MIDYEAGIQLLFVSTALVLEELLENIFSGFLR